MSPKFPRTMLILPLLAVMAAAAPVRGGVPAARVRVIATVFPLAEFARAIGGARVDVRMLLPPGADVHTWQPRASDIRGLETAGLLLSVGSGLEPWLGSLLKGADTSRLARLEAAAGRELLSSEPDADEPEAGGHHEHGAFDPHVWLDFGIDQDLADAIAAALGRLDPAGSADFKAGAASLKARLKTLDESYAKALAPCRGRDFVLGGHAAFGYLAHRYGLRQVALYGASPDAAPTPRQTASAIGRAGRERTATIFYEPGTGDKLARLIAAETGARVAVLYPGHNLTPEQAAAGVTFFKLMEANLESLKNGLGCR